MKVELTSFGEVDPSAGGLWAADKSFFPPSDADYYRAADSLLDHLKPATEPLLEFLSKCYVRGDNYGDYTQHLEIIDPSVFTLDFLLAVHEWVKKNWQWRVFTPCHLEMSQAFTIYAKGFKYSADLHVSLEDAVFNTRRTLETYKKEWDRKERERRTLPRSPNSS